jgi:hypothetical protein
LPVRTDRAANAVVNAFASLGRPTENADRDRGTQNARHHVAECVSRHDDPVGLGVGDHVRAKTREKVSKASA